MSEMPEQEPRSTATVPGDISIERVDLTRAADNATLDLRPFVVEINIYEDIFSPSLYGNLVVRDAVNLIGTFPIMGDETLHLSLSTPFDQSTQFSPSKEDPINKIQKSFAVYAVKNRVLEEHKEQLYVIHFCSQEAIIDNITKICKKYEGTTDEIAKEIWGEYFSDRGDGQSIARYYNITGQETTDASGTKTNTPTIVSSDPTTFVISGTPHQSSLSFVPAMWTPFECINWLAKRTVGKKIDDIPGDRLTSNYLFYETTKGFYYTSLEDLIHAQLKENNVFSDFIFTQKKSRNEDRAFELGYAHVEDLRFKTNMDIIQSQSLGHFTSSLYAFDMVKKEYKLYYYDHVYGFKDGIHMESYKMTDGNAVLKDRKTNEYTNMMFPVDVYRSAESKPIVATIHKGVLDSDSDDNIDLHPNKFVSQRLSSLLDISTVKLEIVVPGRTDAEVGRLARLYFPSVGNVDRTETSPAKWDPLVSGIYMMTAIHHHITKYRHTMTVELAKDSYATPIYPDIVIPEDIPGSMEVPLGRGTNIGTDVSDE